MADIWFISDTHFFHDNIIKYCDRPFKNSGEMNESIVEKWNSVVKREDHVYHLGDVTFRYDGALAALLPRLNGRKRLVLGNHDKLHPTLMQNFEKVVLWVPPHYFGKKYPWVFSHIPLREDQMVKAEWNFHGHIHEKKSPTDRHGNLSVEWINYTPVHLDQLPELMKAQHV